LSLVSADWMNTKQRPAQWFREVAIEFNNGLRQSLEGKNKKHIQNVERTVWIFLDSNTTGQVIQKSMKLQP
jgi:hypothetical protein